MDEDRPPRWVDRLRSARPEAALPWRSCSPAPRPSPPGRRSRTGPGRPRPLSCSSPSRPRSPRAPGLRAMSSRDAADAVPASRTRPRADPAGVGAGGDRPRRRWTAAPPGATRGGQRAPACASAGDPHGARSSVVCARPDARRPRITARTADRRADRGSPRGPWITARAGDRRAGPVTAAGARRQVPRVHLPRRPRCRPRPDAAPGGYVPAVLFRIGVAPAPHTPGCVAARRRCVIDSNSL